MITTNNKTKFLSAIYRNRKQHIITETLNLVTVKMFLRLNNTLKNKLFTMYRYSKKSW